MKEIGVRELKQQAADIIRRVRENKETIVITHRGKPGAKLVPFTGITAEAAEVWAEMDRLTEEISKYLPEGASAVDAVSGQRR